MFESRLNRGKANGYASLDSDGLVPSSSLPPIQSLIDTGSFATTGSNIFTGVQTITGLTSGSLIISNFIPGFNPENIDSFIISATGSSGLWVTSDYISQFGVTDIPELSDQAPKASLFANILDAEYGEGIASGPVAAILTTASGSMPNYWFFDSSGSSFLPGDVTIGYSDVFAQLPKSGSLNIVNGNINVSGSVYVSSSLVVSSTVVSSGTIDAFNSDLIIDGGYIILTGSLVPLSSTGSIGDRRGTIAVDDNYLYYCTASYVDGSDIWKRIAFESGSW